MRLDPETHLVRAQRHQTVGDALAEAGDEWATVCYFYSGYHLMRNALATDPIFNEPTALSKRHPELTMADQHVGRHKGRRGSGQWGVNDLVLCLYGGDVAKRYEQLHQASIAVRYEAGLEIPIPRISQALEYLRVTHHRMQLRA